MRDVWGNSFELNTSDMRIALLFLCLFGLSLSSFAQLRLGRGGQSEMYNFIPDPSFERSQEEPCGWNQGLGKFNKWMVYWTSPTETTPDLLSNRIKSTCWANPSKHSDNRQRPKDGDNMIGIKCYGKGGTDTYWHEYVQVQLKEPLKADSLYYVEFYANASNRASRICNNMGALVSTDPHTSRDRKPLYLTPTINSEKLIKQSILGWKKISGVFRATGDEQYLTIGNFYRDGETESERLETGRDGAYYYIDEVMLRRALPGEQVSPKPRESRPVAELIEVEERTTTDKLEIQEIKYEVGTTVELGNIQFAFDKAELLPISQTELNRLADLMQDNPYIAIAITGHTDNVGDEVYNKKLSANRAQAVVAYLIHKGTDKDRLSFKGMGSTDPLASNDTEAGKEANRRVEFEVVAN